MAAERTGRTNRVRPDGSLAASLERGLLWGNRGALLDAAGRPTRKPTTTAWIICALQYKGWQRTQWQPGRLTELYFLDEATGLAAGHRPCALCRRPAYRAYRAAWELAHPGSEVGARAIDDLLRSDRGTAPNRRPFRSLTDGLPDGAMISFGGAFWLVLDRDVHRWSFGGYTERRRRDRLPEEVEVITPRSTLATLAAGFAPIVHPSAQPQRA